MNVWLDDQREPPPEWVWAKTVDECIFLLEEQYIDQISLDHDLIKTDPEHTGYDVILWLDSIARDDEDFDVPDMIWIHSANNKDWKKMSEGIRSIRRHVKEHKRKL